MSQMHSFLGHIETGFMEHLSSIMTYFKVTLNIQQGITKNVNLTKSTTFDCIMKRKHMTRLLLGKLKGIVHPKMKV